LIGSGGFARETAQAVDAVNAVRPTWELIGFLDDDPSRHGSCVNGVQVLGGTDWLADHPDTMVVVCTGRPTNYWSRLQIVQRLALPEERYATVVHPTCAISRDTVVGAGTVLLAGVVATANVRIGPHVAVMPQVVFTHDDIAARFSTFGSGVRLAGGVGVGTGAYVGAGAMVREGGSIGEWALVGVGAVVLGDVPPHQVWAGVPARYLRGSDAPRGLET
jgi:sugar O-acyltransferase (sialic acid O-acetyltransferase NeuD family)